MSNVRELREKDGEVANQILSDEQEEGLEARH